MSFADGGDSAVHHVAGSDDVGSGSGERDGGFGEQMQGGIVLDFVILAVFFHDSAVAVRGVFAEADVGYEDELLCGGGLLERSQAAVVQSQRAYAESLGVPWGISESSCRPASPARSTASSPPTSI